MTFLTTVTEAEAKVVDAVRDLQAPSSTTSARASTLAGERLPKVTYPAGLPKPTEVIDSQYEFVTALLEAQHDLVKAVAEAVSPLMGVPAKPAPKAKADQGRLRPPPDPDPPLSQERTSRPATPSSSSRGADSASGEAVASAAGRQALPST